MFSLFFLSTLHVLFNSSSSAVVTLLKNEFKLEDIESVVKFSGIYILLRFMASVAHSWTMYHNSKTHLFNILFKHPKAMDPIEFSAILGIHLPIVRHPQDMLGIMNTVLYTLYMLYTHDVIVLIKVSLLFSLPGILLYFIHIVLDKSNTLLMHHRQICIAYFTEYAKYFNIYSQFKTEKQKLHLAQLNYNAVWFYHDLYNAIGWPLFQMSSISVLSALFYFYADTAIEMLLFGFHLVTFSLLLQSYHQYIKKKTSFTTLTNLFHSRVPTRASIPDQNLKIEIVNVSCTLNNTPILHDITTTIFKNTVIIGHTNSGKSTLLKCVANRINYKGHISKIKSIYVDQTMHFLECSILHNLLINGTFYSTIDNVPIKLLNKLEALLKLFQLNVDLNANCTELSMGQLQRLHLIRYLLFATDEWLLLDEPTSHLDAKTKQIVIQYLIDQKFNIIMVSHDMSLINDFDVLQLENGSLIPTRVIKQSIQISEQDSKTVEPLNKTVHMIKPMSLMRCLMYIYSKHSKLSILYALTSWISYGFVIPLQGYFAGQMFTSTDVQSAALNLFYSGCLFGFIEMNMQISKHFLSVQLFFRREIIIKNNFHKEMMLYFTEYVGTIQYLACDGLLNNIRAFCTIIVAFLTMIYFLKHYIIYICLFSGLFTIVFLFITSKLNKLELSIMKQYQRIQDLQCSIVVLNSNNTSYIQDLLLYYKQMITKEITLQILYKSIISGFVDILPLLLLILVVNVAGKLVYYNQMSRSDGSAVLGIVILGGVQLSSFLNGLGNLNGLKTIIPYVKQYLDEPVVDNYDYKPVDVLELKNISYSTILKNVSKTFHKGLTVIQGQSGIGKTTLLKIIANLLPCEGKIISNYQSKILFVDNTYLNTSIRYNICMGHVIKVDLLLKYFELFKLMHLWNKIDFTPDRLQLSGGEQQRIILIRSLVNDYQILLLDEMLSALDEEMTEIVVKELSSTDKIIILVSHRPLSVVPTYHLQHSTLI